MGFSGDFPKLSQNLSNSRDFSRKIELFREIKSRSRNRATKRKHAAGALKTQQNLGVKTFAQLSGTTTFIYFLPKKDKTRKREILAQEGYVYKQIH